MKNRKLNRLFLIILGIVMLIGGLILILYTPRLDIFGQYQVAELTYIDMLTSTSKDVWEERYLGAKVEISKDCINIVDNHGQIHQVKNPDYAVVRNIGDMLILQEYKMSLLQEYKDLFWGTRDGFVDTIENSYVVKQVSDLGSYFMVWESSEEIYLVLYTKGEKKYFATLVVKLQKQYTCKDLKREFEHYDAQVYK